jgi:hypothetical protein
MWSTREDNCCRSNDHGHYCKWNEPDELGWPKLIDPQDFAGWLVTIFRVGWVCGGDRTLMVFLSVEKSIGDSEKGIARGTPIQNAGYDSCPEWFKRHPFTEHNASCLRLSH